MNKGLFVIFERNDGNGEITISKPAYEKLKKMGYPVPYIGEPGSIDTAEQIRNIILDPANTAMDECYEALLCVASRHQHLTEKVLPALKKGKIVLCDRFVDSSLAYQGIARDIGVEEVFVINQFVVGGHLPDATVLLSADFETGLSRVTSHGNKDRLDNESMKLHKLVVQGYELIKGKFKECMYIVDANPDVDTALNNTIACLMEITENYV